MSDQIVFTKEEVSFIRTQLYWAIEHVKQGEPGECPACFRDFNKALSLLDSPRPKVQIPLNIVYEIMLTRWDSIEEGEALIKRSLPLSGFEVIEDGET